MTCTGDVRDVAELVAASAAGDEGAWGELVNRYAPLVYGITRRFGLSRTDAADVNQTVWLRLVEHLGRLREPAALPSWIATTTRHECIRLSRASRMTRSFDPLEDQVSTAQDGPGVDEDLLRAERHQALRDAVAQLPPHCQRLLAMLLREPPPSYGDIGSELRIPVGSIGPTRARCLHKLRQSPALAAYTDETSVKESRHEAIVGR